MSKDIWHITNQDENTTDVPEEEGFVVLIGHWTSCLWYGGETPEPIFWENVKKWCYLDDLLACEQELIRTHKALDKGMEHITGLNNMIESWYKLLQSDKDASTKYAILKSAISAYVENKGDNNE